VPHMRTELQYWLLLAQSHYPDTGPTSWVGKICLSRQGRTADLPLLSRAPYQLTLLIITLYNSKDINPIQNYHACHPILIFWTRSIIWFWLFFQWCIIMLETTLIIICQKFKPCILFLDRCFNNSGVQVFF
jgi:hypothetical protein